MTCQLRTNESKQTQYTNNNHFHEAESLLRNHQLLSQSRKSLKFYGTQHFVTVYTKPATGPYSQPDKFSPHLSILQLKIQRNIHPSSTWSSKWSHSLGISYQNLEHTCSDPDSGILGSIPQFDDHKKDSRFSHLRVNWS